MERRSYFQYIAERLAFLKEEGHPLTGLRFLDLILKRIGTETSLFPYISKAGDHEVSAEWIAGGDRIEIETDGCSFSVLVRESGKVTVNAECTSIHDANEILLYVEGVLNTFTERVNAVNPNWHIFFPIKE